MKTIVAQCAALIRKDLKANFPETKFSVTSENFSMGNSITISWDNQDLPSAKVRFYIDKYKDGDFDGMTDSYEHRPSVDYPRAKFIRYVNNNGRLI